MKTESLVYRQGLFDGENQREFSGGIWATGSLHWQDYSRGFEAGKEKRTNDDNERMMAADEQDFDPYDTRDW